MGVHRNNPSPRPDFSEVPSARRRNMAAIRGADTRPEMQVRRAAHALGYRFRLHVKDLPGRPDLVFPGRRKVIFVHGCFWHRHGCRNSVLPRARREWWEAKLDGNVQRDRRNREALEVASWSVLVLWECELRDPESLKTILRDFLGPSPRTTAVLASEVSSPSRPESPGDGIPKAP